MPHTSSTRLKPLSLRPSQPVADLRSEIEVVHAPYPAAHAWSDHRSSSPMRPDRNMVLTGLSVRGAPGLSGRLLHEHARSGFNALGVACLWDSRLVIASGLKHSDVSVANENPGSLTGSQRPQTSGCARPRPAILSATRWHVRPHSAPRDHASKVPPKQ